MTELLKDAVYPAVCPLCGDVIPTARRIAYHRTLEADYSGKFRNADRRSSKDACMQRGEFAALQSEMPAFQQPGHPADAHDSMRQPHTYHRQHIFRAYYQGLVCSSCLDALKFVNAPCCEKCGKPLLHDNSGRTDGQNPKFTLPVSQSEVVPQLCSDCRTHERSFTQSVALLSYDERMRDIMADIKYKGRQEYLKLFGVLAAERFGDWMLGNGINCLIPVPVHASRLKKRGFNQSELLCRHISNIMHIPVRNDIIIRNKKTAAQKELNVDERLLNLQSAFSTAGRLPSGTNALIVDDIYTTGSTMEACTERILEAGASKVYGLAVCIGEDKNS